MRCKRCGYELQGLRDDRCPECGRSFDPDDSSSYLVKPVSGRGPLVFSVVALIMVVVPAVVASLDDMGLAVPRSVFFIVPIGAMMPAGIILGCWMLQMTGRAVGGRLPWTVHQGAFTAGFIVSLLTVVGALGAVVFQLLRRVMS